MSYVVSGNAAKDLVHYSSKDAVLNRYIQEVRSIPSLDKDEEYKLAIEFVETGNIEIANLLVKSHLKNVVRIAFGYRNYGLSLMDIIAEGNLGLIHAVKKFEPNSGFRFSTYASWWVMAYINDFVLRSWSLVKIGTTKLQKKIFFNLNKIKRRLGLGTNTPLTGNSAKIVAQYLDSSEQEIIEIDQRITSPDLSLDAIMSTDEDSASFGSFIENDTLNPEQELMIKMDKESRISLIHKALATLSDREREIINARFLSDTKATLQELSEKMKISKERIRQIEERCIEKIKQHCL